MRLIDMKQKRKKSDLTAPTEAKMPKEEYPWGIRLTLESEQMKKLGLSADDLEYGDKVEITGEGTVESVNISKDSDGKKRESVSIQIKEMAVM